MAVLAHRAEVDVDGLAVVTESLVQRIGDSRVNSNLMSCNVRLHVAPSVNSQAINMVWAVDHAVGGGCCAVRPHMALHPTLRGHQTVLWVVSACAGVVGRRGWGKRRWPTRPAAGSETLAGVAPSGHADPVLQSTSGVICLRGGPPQRQSAEGEAGTPGRHGVRSGRDPPSTGVQLRRESALDPVAP